MTSSGEVGVGSQFPGLGAHQRKDMKHVKTTRREIHEFIFMADMESEIGMDESLTTQAAFRPDSDHPEACGDSNDEKPSTTVEGKEAKTHKGRSGVILTFQISNGKANQFLMSRNTKVNF